MSDSRATAERFADGPTTVVVDPGQAPPHVPPVLEVRGPLAVGRVSAALDHAARRTPGGGPWHHRLQRLGPDHHLLHVEPRTGAAVPGAPHEDPAPFPAGLVADLLTAPGGPAVPLSPAQLDLARRADGEDAPGPGLFRALNAAEPFDPAAVDAALRALARAHPLLGTRIDTTKGGALHTEPLAYTAQCVVLTDVARAREHEAVAAAARRLDPATGGSLCALLLRKRHRLVLVAHELVADQLSLDILMADLRATLARPGEEPAAEHVRYADWSAALPVVATDPRETGRWHAVAEGRAAARAFRPRAPLPDSAPHRHAGFSLGRAATGRLTGAVPRDLGLTPAQLLTGAMGLALIRWRGTQRASFDVFLDGRQGGPALARTVGPLAETEPVLLEGGDEESARQFIARLAPALGDLGRGAFGACREHAPDPVLRLALREPVPVLVRFTPDARSRAARQQPQRGAVSYALDVDARIRGGRLCVGLDWLPAVRDGVTEESAGRLLAVLRDVLDELSGGARLSHPTTGSVAPSPVQRELLADADAHPGTGRQIEQLSWIWHGPLDVARFTAAWQSVFDREAALRSAFDHGPDSMITIHDRVVPEVVRTRNGGAGPGALADDRRRGLDPRSPGPLRITLLDGPGDIGAAVPATRVLLTYHLALLDTWSVRLLVAEFCRAYLADGPLPGGDRRPDVRDYAHWIEGQDLAAAGDFWLHSALRPAAAVPSHVIASPVARGSGSGRARVRLTSSEAARLDAWAARWGATESGALQAAWALLLYRSAEADGSMPVRFSVAVSGRGIPLEGVELLPGALRNSLPVSVEVDPAATVPDLLAALRDQAIDVSSYEWVSAGQIHGWTGAVPDGPFGQERTTESLLVFESGPDPLRRFEPSFAADGIRMEFPETTGAASAFPVTLVARRDGAGGLVLSVIHDRARLADGTGLLSDCADLLRELPHEADESTPIAELLGRLTVTAAAQPAFLTLRQGTGGVICLVPSPDVPRAWYARLARQHAGPETVILLRFSPEGPRAWHRALRAPAEAGPLLLVAFSGGGAGAYETARRLAADGLRTRTAVLTADTGTDVTVGGLACLLGETARRPGDA
ncbi:condensation domain-containing protein [Streptomyces sp. NPDC047525]|uniref:condensation domain-containing protein n=1 Tax=Streptomyces sp. NPDC047525 TaxID=3155264 RepID=UPI0033FDD0C8